jgi:hypothetical protein
MEGKHQSCVWTPELAEYAARLWTPKVAARKRAAAEGYRQSPRRRRLAELHFAQWRRYFETCEQFPEKFLDNPLLIDLFLLDVERLAEFVDLALCPWLADLLSEVGGVASRTRPMRSSMYGLLNVRV